MAVFSKLVNAVAFSAATASALAVRNAGCCCPHPAPVEEPLLAITDGKGNDVLPSDASSSVDDAADDDKLAPVLAMNKANIDAELLKQKRHQELEALNAEKHVASRQRRQQIDAFNADQEDVAQLLRDIQARAMQRQKAVQAMNGTGITEEDALKMVLKLSQNDLGEEEDVDSKLVVEEDVTSAASETNWENLRGLFDSVEEEEHSPKTKQERAAKSVEDAIAKAGDGKKKAVVVKRQALSAGMDSGNEFVAPAKKEVVVVQKPEWKSKSKKILAKFGRMTASARVAEHERIMALSTQEE